MSKGRKTESQENVFDMAIQTIRNGEPYQELLSKIKATARAGASSLTINASELDQNMLAVLQFDLFKTASKTDAVQISWSAEQSRRLLSQAPH